MLIVDFIGYFAGFLTTVSAVPQAYKSFKTKSTRDLSYLYLTVLTVGVFVWVIYGFLINSYPVIVTNSVSFVLMLLIDTLKLKYK